MQPDRLYCQKDKKIREPHIPMGNFDNVGDCTYAIPTHWDIGRVLFRK